jgi:hypothetical protein
MLASHRLYLETEYHEGHRANFLSADLTGRGFSGLNLRGIKMDRAVLRGADFTYRNSRTPDDCMSPYFDALPAEPSLNLYLAPAKFPTGCPEDRPPHSPIKR